jgi:tripartite-type tricarboxylate transporter receptor subunit TctC
MTSKRTCGLGLIALVSMTLACAICPARAAAPKGSFPERNKTITIIVSYNAGGNTDIAARAVAPLLEKEFGIPVQVLNKPGAGGQVGYTQLANAKPDGYTLGIVGLPAVNGIYLDSERKALFDRASFQPLALQAHHPGLLAVRADSPYKTVQDLVAAAKANPEKLTANTTGILGDDHLAVLQFQTLTGTKFAIVHFDGTAPATTAFLGGHIDLYVGNLADLLSHLKAGTVRILGIADKVESSFYPGVKTFEAQGIPLYASSDLGVVMPAGAPKEVVEILGAALEKACKSETHVKKMESMGIPAKCEGPAGFTKVWGEMDAWAKPNIEAEKAKAKK